MVVQIDAALNIVSLSLTRKWAISAVKYKLQTIDVTKENSHHIFYSVFCDEFSYDKLNKDITFFSNRVS